MFISTKEAEQVGMNFISASSLLLLQEGIQRLGRRYASSKPSLASVAEVRVKTGMGLHVVIISDVYLGV
jgi:hypothetical protein